MEKTTNELATIIRASCGQRSVGTVTGGHTTELVLNVVPERLAEILLAVFLASILSPHPTENKGA